MTITKELLDELLSGVENANDLLGDKGLMKELKVRLMERMLGAELTEHLGYEPHGEPTSEQTNRRNGATRKVLKGNDGAVPIDIPRDRPSHRNCVSMRGAVDGCFEPELIKKGQIRIDGMDDSEEDQKTVRGAVFPTHHRALCGGFVYARHSCSPRRCLRPEGVSRPCQPCHRCWSG